MANKPSLRNTCKLRVQQFDNITISAEDFDWMTLSPRGILYRQNFDIIKLSKKKPWEMDLVPQVEKSIKNGVVQTTSVY